MPKRKQKRTSSSPRAKTYTKPAANSQEYDSVFLLKIALYLILGSMWLKISHDNTVQLPIPVGLILGVIFAFHDHFQIDRKIEYAVLFVAMLVGFFAPFGLYISLG